MKAQDYFIFGTKLFGIWCLFQGFAYLFAVVPTFVQGGVSNPAMNKIMIATKISTWLIPVFYIFAGLYLLKGGRYLQKLVGIDESKVVGEMELKLIFFIKLLGIYLLANYIPELLRTSSAFVAYLVAPPYFNMFQQQSFTAYNGASSIGGVLLGWYCLNSEKLFVTWAMKSIQTNSTNK